MIRSVGFRKARSVKPRLGDFAHDVHSQAGEDGILRAVFDRIGVRSRVCIEFGAWDGLYLSNAAQFWRSGWRAILIEAAPDRYSSLVRNTLGYDCLCLNHMVRPDGEDALEPLLRRHGQDGPVDLLVIDVDGDDYHIFSALQTLRPRVVCCEYNPTIPGDSDLVGRRGDALGCSARALVARAEEMGYGLVAMTAVNCVFVLANELPAFNELETRFESLFPAANLVTLITTYDGRFMLSREPPYGLTAPHHGGSDQGIAFEVQETLAQKLATHLSQLWLGARTSLALRLSRGRGNGE
jgi:hypothetical protein